MLSLRSLSITFASSLIALSALADGPAVPGGAVAPAGAANAPAAVGPGSMLVPFALMFAVMYFLMIRPQQKRMKAQQAMLGALKEGDEVLTTSGILGKVGSITDKIVTIQLDGNVKVRMLKSQVSQVIQDGKV